MMLGTYNMNIENLDGFIYQKLLTNYYPMWFKKDSKKILSINKN